MFLGTSDVTAKYLSKTLPSIEITWIRFLVFAVIMVPAMLPGSPLFALRSQPPGLQLMRGVGAAGLVAVLHHRPAASADRRGVRHQLRRRRCSSPRCRSSSSARRSACGAGLRPRVGLVGVLIILRPGTSALPSRRVLSDRSPRCAWACTLIMTRMMSGQRARHHDHDLFVDRGRLHHVRAGAVRLGRAELARCPVRHPRSALPRPPDSGSWCWRSAMPMPRCSRRFPTPSCCGSASLGFLIFGEVPDAWHHDRRRIHRRQRPLHRASRARPAVACSC